MLPKLICGFNVIPIKISVAFFAEIDKLILKFTYEFPGGLVVRIPGFHCHGPGSVPGWGTEIPQAVR